MQNGEFGGLADELPYVAHGGSVAMFAVQLASWMGFQRIYLIGCDASRQGHAGGLGLGPEDKTRNRQDTFIRSAKAAEELLAKHDRRLIDLTEGGALTVAKDSLKAVLKSGQ